MKHSKTDDLWYEFLRGDDYALSKLYIYYVHKLFSYGLKIHGDDQLVKDCIQEVFIHLIDQRKKLTFSAATSAYLFKSLRNKLIEELRSKNRRKDIVQSIEFNVTSLSAEQIKIYSEEEQSQKRAMAEAIDSLTDHQKEAVYLKYSQDLGYKKIAEILKIDSASVRTLICRSLKKVKETLVDNSRILLFYLNFILF